MIKPRWRKILGDIRATKGRMIMMVLAIAVGVFGIGTILTAYTVLTREISLNYQSTNPATAYLKLDHVEPSLLEKVNLRSDIKAAEITAWVDSRIEVKPNEWFPLLLFVVEDFNHMQLNTFRPETGAWPPTEGSILLERTALTLVEAKIGDSFRVQTPSGPKQSVPISGTVHDPGLAPAWQEQTAYGYVTSSTLRGFGESHTSPILKVLVQDQSLDRTKMENTIRDLAEWLKLEGYTVGEIRIPPIGKHPHQSQLTSILIILLIFSVLALTLSSVLTATMIGGMLAQQVRQIGVMKAIGARTGQIAGLYLLLIVLVGILAVILGLPISLAAGRGFASVVANLLNFTLYSDSISAWNYAVLILAGLFIPLLLSLFPIMRATRMTVREAINDYGTSRNSFGSNRLDAWLGRIRWLDRTLLLSLRNTFRRRGRLVLTLSLLAMAGGMFLTSLNVKTGWENILSEAASNRQYDMEIQFHEAESEERLVSVLQTIDGVKQVEAWNRVPAAADRPDNLNIVRTYPDGGHGSFNIRSVPADSNFVRFNLMEGRLLQYGDPDPSVILNHMGHALFPTVKVGDLLPLAVDGTQVQLRLVGIVRENLSPATAYLTEQSYSTVVGLSGQANSLRITLEDSFNSNGVIRDIERVLVKNNVPVEAIISESMLDEAVSGHVYILIFALVFISVLMAIVGALGLMSTMGTNVIERTREFGIMRTIGGRSSTVLRNIVSEGIFIGLMSFVAALVISLPLTSAVGRFIGELAFRSPLPLVLSPTALFIWLAVIVLGAVLASAYPAWKASRLTIRDTLDYI